MQQRLSDEEFLSLHTQTLQRLRRLEGLRVAAGVASALLTRREASMDVDPLNKEQHD